MNPDDNATSDCRSQALQKRDQSTERENTIGNGALFIKERRERIVRSSHHGQVSILFVVIRFN